jgi:hypothetical protein
MDSDIIREEITSVIESVLNTLESHIHPDILQQEHDEIAFSFTIKRLDPSSLELPLQWELTFTSPYNVLISNYLI